MILLLAAYKIYIATQLPDLPSWTPWTYINDTCPENCYPTGPSNQARRCLTLGSNSSNQHNQCGGPMERRRRCDMGSCGQKANCHFIICICIFSKIYLFQIFLDTCCSEGSRLMQMPKSWPCPVGTPHHVQSPKVSRNRTIALLRFPPYFPPDLPYGIRGHVGAFIEGRPIFCGGEATFASSFERRCVRYSFANQSWSLAPFQMRRMRKLAASVVLPNGTFFVIGGEEVRLILSTMHFNHMSLSSPHSG